MTKLLTSRNKYVLVDVPNIKTQSYERHMVRVSTVLKWLEKSFDKFLNAKDKMDRLMMGTLIVEHVQALVNGHCLPVDMNEQLKLVRERINGSYVYIKEIEDLMVVVREHYERR